ncbi:M56 family metallopeptidase [Hymenobacter sp. CRA2]|uniref:M56 family metallopeptidase n=1 Tax=Hymenobacter sp. CRA2 TaxID=1955620 RepID=UPI00098F7C4B|nr:M56 family metallopeptidase [Hymenobacter sp. CRA2]OON71096.1 hypothetical protein B0919_03650 [Hymenobacter sp. CRA2]
MSTPDLLLYLLKVNGALLLFCGVYYLVLRRLTFFRLNRALLLAALLWAPIYPLIDVSRWWQQPAPAELLRLAPDWAVLAPAAAATPAALDGLLLVYWLGVVVLAVRLVLQLGSLYRLHCRSRPATFGGVPFRAVAEPISPFAFWQTVYLNPAQHQQEELPAILCHERVHVREWHTVDVLLAQLSLLFYWFNPGVWLLRQALHENLEFQTDYRVLQSGMLDSKTYQYSLLRQNVGTRANGLVSHFNLHLLKTRIAMMNKPRTAAAQAARYLLLLPLAGLLALGGCDRKTETVKPEALYYLDGQLSSAAAAQQLDSKNIESMNVLKGEAANKEFGPDGAAGVIVITTKQNAASPAVVEFNKQHRIQ